jgi:hypothetical protein
MFIHRYIFEIVSRFEWDIFEIVSRFEWDIFENE